MVNGKLKRLAILGGIGLVCVACRTGHAGDVGIYHYGTLLSVSGTDAADDIFIYEQERSASFNFATGEFQPAGAYVVVWALDRYGKTTGYYGAPKTSVGSVAVRGNRGNDFITADTDVRVSLYGDEGADVLLGGRGDDYLHAGIHSDLDYCSGGPGRDFLVAAKYPPSYLYPTRWTTLRGDAGEDTFLYTEVDKLVFDTHTAWGVSTRPDFKHWSGQYRGMYQITE